MVVCLSVLFLKSLVFRGGGKDVLCMYGGNRGVFVVLYIIPTRVPNHAQLTHFLPQKPESSGYNLKLTTNAKLPLSNVIGQGFCAL
jgi:hypothetical protein